MSEEKEKERLPKMSDPVLVDYEFRMETRFFFGLLRYPKMASFHILAMSLLSCALIWLQVLYFTSTGNKMDVALDKTTFIPSIILLLIASDLRDAKSYKYLCDMFRREPRCVDMTKDEMEYIINTVYRSNFIGRFFRNFLYYTMWMLVGFAVMILLF